MLAFVTSLRHPQNSADYARVERLLAATLRSVVAQVDDDFVVIVVGNQEPSFALPSQARFVKVDFPAPAPPDGPRTAREPFVRDKGSKIGVGLIAARDFDPDYVMIFDADDFVSRRLAGWVNARGRSSGWVIEHGWMYSAARGAMRPQENFNRTCGTCFIIPFDAYRVPEHLDVGASQEEVLDAYGEILPNILGAHRDAIHWYAAHGRVLETLPFRGAVYHVDTGENHSGKAMTDLALPLSRSLAREFTIPRRPFAVAWWRSAGPRPLRETLSPKVRDGCRRLARFVGRGLGR